MVATRISLAVGFISVFISLVIGIILGLISGYYGSWVDKTVMWLINVVWSIPTLLMVIAITLALGKGFLMVASSPLTRSSYHATEDFQILQNKRK